SIESQRTKNKVQSSKFKVQSSKFKDLRPKTKGQRPRQLIMLTLDNVSVNYGAIEALTGISMHVETGEVVTLIGANGAGKTTTLRTITGLLQPRQGRITFEGEEISGRPTHKLVARGISMSPEGRGVFANLSVRENLQMGAYL